VKLEHTNRHKHGEDLISVVIPTHNRAHIIVDAINSVLAQSYRPLELLVVDDGSTDDTEAIIANWIKASDGQFGIRFIHQENRGGNAARNNGIRHARGKYVAFLDSDDLWHSDKLKNQMQVFDSDSEIGGVYCGVQHVDLESGKIIEPTNRSYPTGWLLEQMLVRDVTAPTSTYLVKSVVFDEVGGFDVNLPARQDWDMWIRLASKYKIGCVPEVLVDYREHSGVRTKSDPKKEITAFCQIRRKYSDYYAHCPFSTRQAAKATYYRRMGRVHFHQGISRHRAMLYHFQSILSWPFDFDSYAALLGMIVPAGLRQKMHRGWNSIFGRTRFAIRSH
jgi:glycosyltransferase involved in cell wall biosynthesis